MARGTDVEETRVTGRVVARRQGTLDDPTPRQATDAVAEPTGGLPRPGRGCLSPCVAVEGTAADRSLVP